MRRLILAIVWSTVFPVLTPSAEESKYDCLHLIQYDRNDSPLYTLLVSRTYRWLEFSSSGGTAQVIASKPGEKRVYSEVNPDQDTSGYRLEVLPDTVQSVLGVQWDWLGTDFLGQPEFPPFSPLSVSRPTAQAQESGLGHPSMEASVMTQDIEPQTRTVFLSASYFDSTGRVKESLNRNLTVSYLPNGMPKKWRSLFITNKSTSPASLRSWHEIDCDYLESTARLEKPLKPRSFAPGPPISEWNALLGRTPERRGFRNSPRRP